MTIRHGEQLIRSQNIATYAKAARFWNSAKTSRRRGDVGAPRRRLKSATLFDASHCACDRGIGGARPPCWETLRLTMCNPNVSIQLRTAALPAPTRWLRFSSSPFDDGSIRFARSALHHIRHLRSAEMRCRPGFRQPHALSVSSVPAAREHLSRSRALQVVKQLFARRGPVKRSMNPARIHHRCLKILEQTARFASISWFERIRNSASLLTTAPTTSRPVPLTGMIFKVNAPLASIRVITASKWRQSHCAKIHTHDLTPGCD
jgi:hypothetical protein